MFRKKKSVVDILAHKINMLDLEREQLQQELDKILEFSSEELIEYKARKYVEKHCEAQDF